MKTYYVYILECSDGLLYTGMTNDLTKRLESHNSGSNKTSFTFKRRPVELIFYQDFNDVHQAIYFEKKLKKWSAQKKRALARGDYDMIQILAACRNVTHHDFKPDSK